MATSPNPASAPTAAPRTLPPHIIPQGGGVTDGNAAALRQEHELADEPAAAAQQDAEPRAQQHDEDADPAGRRAAPGAK